MHIKNMNTHQKYEYTLKNQHTLKISTHIENMDTHKKHEYTADTAVSTVARYTIPFVWLFPFSGQVLFR